jgi:hypothetical protein
MIEAVVEYGLARAGCGDHRVRGDLGENSGRHGASQIDRLGFKPVSYLVADGTCRGFEDGQGGRGAPMIGAVS